MFIRHWKEDLIIFIYIDFEDNKCTNRFKQIIHLMLSKCNIKKKIALALSVRRRDPILRFFVYKRCIFLLGCLFRFYKQTEILSKGELMFI